MTEASKLSIAITPTAGAAGTSDILGATVDMANYGALRVTVQFGAITAGAVTSIKLQQGSQSDMSDAADLAGTAQTIADSDDDRCFFIDLARPTKRFVRVVADRGTQNAVVASAHYEQYQASVKAVTHGANVSGERWVSPPEGTT